jgi:hypothetical protein
MISNLNLIYIVSIVYGVAVHMITIGSLSLRGHQPTGESSLPAFKA